MGQILLFCTTKKKYILSLFFFSTLLIQGIQSQQIIWMEDFEDCGNTANCNGERYTSSHDFFRTNTIHDYWGRVNANTREYYLSHNSSGKIASSVSTYKGQNGDFYYAGEDLDNMNYPRIGSPDGDDTKSIHFKDIDITGAKDAVFKGLFASGENDPCGKSTYDKEDYIKIYYNIDNSGEVLGMCFNSARSCGLGVGKNNPLHHDPNCDGDGAEGQLLTSTFQEFSFDIPEGSTMDLRITVHMDGGSEEIAFDYFTIEANSPLPIELLSFTAKVEDDSKTMLEWTTLKEENNAGFEVYHSVDARNWQLLDFVDGKGTSDLKNNYHYMHEEPSAGINYYRFDQIDLDGRRSTSPLTSIVIKNDNEISIFPNPSTNGLINIVGLTSGSYKLYNSIGQFVTSSTFNSSQINLNNVDKGSFILQLNDGNSTINKLVIIK